jgi:hypothetical protein
MSVDENHLLPWKAMWTETNGRSFLPGEILKELVAAVNKIVEVPIKPPKQGGVVGILNLIPADDYARVIRSLTAVDDGGKNAPLDESVEAVATGLAPELSQTPLAGGSREPKRQNQGNDTARTLEKPWNPPKKPKTTEVPANEHVPRAQKRTISGENSGDISVAKTTVIAEEPAPARKRQNCGDILESNLLVEATDEIDTRVDGRNVARGSSRNACLTFRFPDTCRYYPDISSDGSNSFSDDKRSALLKETIKNSLGNHKSRLQCVIYENEIGYVAAIYSVCEQFNLSCTLVIYFTLVTVTLTGSVCGRH